MVCRKGEDVLVKSTVVVAKIRVYLCLTRGVSLKIANDVYMDRVIPFGQFAQRLVLAAGCHENQPTKRNHVFERKKALKRCVANRPLQTMLGRFCKAVLNLRFPIMTAYIGGRCFH